MIFSKALDILEIFKTTDITKNNINLATFVFLIKKYEKNKTNKSTHTHKFIK